MSREVDLKALNDILVEFINKHNGDASKLSEKVLEEAIDSLDDPEQMLIGLSGNLTDNMKGILASAGLDNMSRKLSIELRMVTSDILNKLHKEYECKVTKTCIDDNCSVKGPQTLDKFYKKRRYQDMIHNYSNRCKVCELRRASEYNIPDMDYGCHW